ncbi:unnamed protein product [Tetraodon nigroviridis]|uniref:(spotted green pufferfish) hypothetical protein n=1 Tax=Tetraodon nigroviridis TaxID=99883 RepID=Q4RZM1_TETNG|nr:unnamed protein product [Tetraodon nigroviridis]
MKELEMQTSQCLQAKRNTQADCATPEVCDREVKQRPHGQAKQWYRQVLFTPPVHHRSSFVTPFPVNSTPLPPTSKDSNHQLHNRSEFKKRSLNDRHMYAREYGLCYGCLKPGHSVKECYYRHTYDPCKGRHPNRLHGKNYRKDGAEEDSAILAPGASKETRSFYQSHNKHYRDVREKINQHHGQHGQHGHHVQSTFMEKLSKWPKIKPTDIEGLKAMADFLNAFLQATPQVKGSEVFSNSEENQMLLQKIPKWLESRWNQQVSEVLMNGGDSPTFADFAKFVSREADMACNAVKYLYDFHPRIPREIKGKKATVFSPQNTAKSNNKQTQMNGKLRPPRPCTLCKKNTHQLHNCEFMKSSLEDRRIYVRDYWLCYGCLKPGHSVKECRHRHTCNVCKGRHPTCLHDENYRKDGPKEGSETIAPSI